MHRLVLAPPTVVLLLVAPVLVAFYRHHPAGERALVAQVAALEASWLETWFDERRASAGLSGTSFPPAEPYLAATLEGSTGDAVRVRSYR
ncbi:MAG: hypothetical protein K0A98_12030, partial [Trueperaceae bacterium]|nr:hypothetical protein [Trueperaceae bacterium]